MQCSFSALLWAKIELRSKWQEVSFFPTADLNFPTENFDEFYTESSTEIFLSFLVIYEAKLFCLFVFFFLKGNRAVKPNS